MVKIVTNNQTFYKTVNRRRTSEGYRDKDVIIGENVSKLAKEFLKDGTDVQFFGSQVGKTVYVGFGGVILYGNVKFFKSVS